MEIEVAVVVEVNACLMFRITSSNHTENVELHPVLGT